MHAPPADTERPTVVPSRPPALVDGIELVGEFEDSGYRVPPQLVYRPDGQVVHLPDLLYLLVKLMDRRHAGRRRQNAKKQDPAAVLSYLAVRLSRETGRDFTADHIAFLLDRKLAPLGITTYSDGRVPVAEKAKPFLALRFRVAVIPASVSWGLGGAFRWLFRPVALLVVVSAVLFSEIWLFMTQNVGAAVAQTLVSPLSILLVIAFAVASSAFHEVGHAAACRYSGARPGVMGCGLYLVWPAFYTDITDSYRLDRTGRLRTDLGGVYFNALFVIAMTAAYVWTGSPILLVAILSTNLEMLQQLLPTLRFDGYYIVSDLVGIPDLFKYIGPILKRSVLRRPADPRLDALKRWPQLVVTIWVLTVLPALAVQLGIVVVRLPGMVRSSWRTVTTLVDSATASGHPSLAMVAAGLQVVLLMLPVVGIMVIFVQLLRALIKLARNRVAFLRALADRLQERIPPRLLSATVTLLLVILLVGVGWVLTGSSSPPVPPVAAPSPSSRSTPGADDLSSGRSATSPAPKAPIPGTTKPANDAFDGPASDADGAAAAQPPRRSGRGVGNRVRSAASAAPRTGGIVPSGSQTGRPAQHPWRQGGGNGPSAPAQTSPAGSCAIPLGLPLVLINVSCGS